jgi:DNA-binding response OmpR family regulator
VDVCIIEDDAAIQEVVTVALEEEDLRVVVCPLGWLAHLCIRRQPPRVVILDVQMPSVDGIQLFYSLRADPKTRTLPVIFLTANPQKVRQELPNYADLGAVIVPKPFNVAELLELVTQALAA